MKKWKKILLIVGIVLVLAIAGLFIANSLIPSNTTTVDISTLKTTAAAKGKLSTSVSGTGTIRSKQTATLSWETSGKVESINVEVGDVVTADSILASLESSSLTPSMISAKQELADAEQNLDDVKNSNSKAAAAEQALLTAKSEMEDAEWTYNNLKSSRYNQTYVDAAQADFYIAKANLEKAQERYDNMEGDPATSTAKAQMLATLSAAKQAYKEAETTLNWYLGSASQEEIDQAKADWDVAKAAYEDAQREYDRLKNGPNDVDIAAAQAQVDSIKATLDQQFIISPIDGTVTVVDTAVGDLVKNGTSAFRVDDLSSMYIDLTVSEIDINSIQVGQSVIVSFDAISEKTYSGKVVSVGQVGTLSGGSVNFAVTVSVDDVDQAVKTGMTATANIIVDSSEEVLLVPSKTIKTVNNQKVVYTLNNGILLPVPVQVGETSDSMTEILGGNLKEGDLVVTNMPTTTTTTEQGGLFGGLFGNLFGGMGAVNGNFPSGGGPGGGEMPSGGFPSGGEMPAGGSMPSGGGAPSGNGG